MIYPLSKKTAASLALAGCLLAAACTEPSQSPETNRQEQARADSLIKLREDSLLVARKNEAARQREDSLAAIVKARPVKGERRQVTGDFDGDGTQDTLAEQYISLQTGRETNKQYDWDAIEDPGVDYIYYLQMWTVEKTPLVRLKSKKAAIPSFDVEYGGAQLGFGYLENVGDLNGDGGDDIIYYIADADMSNINSCAIATLKPKGWKEVRHWTIHEFDFYDDPDNPALSPPVFIRKKGDKTQYRLYGDGGYEWKRLNTNW